MGLRSMAAALVVAGHVLGACDDEGAARCSALAEGQRIVLVDHDLWRLAEAEEDPWAAARPVDISCDESGRQPEDFGGTYSYGIDTGLCGYTTVVQELGDDVCAGDNLFVWAWHFALAGPEGAEAHVAVQLGDEPVFEDVIPMPATSALKVVGYPITRDHKAGTKIFYHVRNHGTNSYQLLELARCRGECRPQ